MPYVALARQASEIKTELLQALESVLESGRYILGPEVVAFEREFASYCGAGLAIGVGSGAGALKLALQAMNIQPGDEVITTSHSFVATAAAISTVGARPVFVDIGRDLNIDPARIEPAITPRTRMILPVHLAGRPARMDLILEIAERHGLVVLEDAAQSVGARLHDRTVGSWGNAACFSFHPLKNLHAYGDAGAITTSDEALHEQIAKSRNHGLCNRDVCEFWGYNCRLDELQAAFLRVQLARLDAWTEERRRLAFRYNELLRPYVEVPDEAPGERCVYQTYVVQAEDRDALREHLQVNGVEALVHYPIPIHLQPAAAALGGPANDLPQTMRACSRILSLPLYPGMTEAQQDRVVELIAGFYRCAGRKD